MHVPGAQPRAPRPRDLAQGPASPEPGLGLLVPGARPRASRSGSCGWGGRLLISTLGRWTPALCGLRRWPPTRACGCQADPPGFLGLGPSSAPRPQWSLQVRTTCVTSVLGFSQLARARLVRPECQRSAALRAPDSRNKMPILGSECGAPRVWGWPPVGPVAVWAVAVVAIHEHQVRGRFFLRTKRGQASGHTRGHQGFRGGRSCPETRRVPSCKHRHWRLQ